MNLRRIDLRAEGVTPNRNIQHTERLLPRSRIVNHSREHNQPGTGSQGRQAPRNRLNQRLAQPKNPGQPVNRGRFAAGQNQRIQVRQLLGTFDEHHLRSQGFEHTCVFGNAALQRQNTHGFARTGQGSRGKNLSLAHEPIFLQHEVAHFVER